MTALPNAAEFDLRIRESREAALQRFDVDAINLFSASGAKLICLSEGLRRRVVAGRANCRGFRSNHVRVTSGRHHTSRTGACGEQQDRQVTHIHPPFVNDAASIYFFPEKGCTRLSAFLGQVRK